MLVDGSAAVVTGKARSSSRASMKTRHRPEAAQAEGLRGVQSVDAAPDQAQSLAALLARTLRDCEVVVCKSPDSALAFLLLGKRPLADDGAARPGIAFPPRPADADPARLADADRSLLTLLFTDIVGSTEIAERLGDDAWESVLTRHNAVVREQLSRFRGSEVDNTGDGFFATFDGPARAVRCAAAIRGALASLGLEIRAAVHCGECATVGRSGERRRRGTSRRGWSTSPSPGKCWSRGPCATWYRARGWRSPTATGTPSRACADRASCSP